MVEIFYSEQYVASSYAFDTTRKAKSVADSLAASPIPGLELVTPQSLDRSDLLEVHDAAYVSAVETGNPRELAESQGFPWDPGMWPMALAANGGVVAAALSALEHGVAGSLSNGFHHAARSRGSGFCTFNGLAIAARAALRKGARSVLILDLDAHCGGGTASLIADMPEAWQLDVSVNSFDSYRPTERAWLEMVRDGAGYIVAISSMLKRADEAGLQFDLCIYNAGMDPFEGCAIGGMRGITRDVLAERERMVFDWCAKRGMPVAFVPAGGYEGGQLDRAALVELHRLTLSAAAAVEGVLTA